MIAIVDCNNFYASCERLFQPHLQGKPVVVLSNNDGCVIARSDEAKALGIVMGTPAFMAEQMMIEKGVAVFSSNYSLYGSLSDRVMRTMAQFTASMEIYSIDEAFLFLGDLYDVDLLQHCIHLRNKVKTDVGIPVSVGVAPTKTLAKMANRFAKKHKKEIGVHVLDEQWKIDEVLKATKVEDIWGVGRQYAMFLIKHGFHTAYELSQAPDEWIRKNMTVVGQRLLNELRGIPCIEFELEPPGKKGICTSRSFGRVVTSKREVAEALTSYTAVAAEKLRRQNSCTKVINVFVQTNMHRAQDEQYFRSLNVTLPVATSSTRELIQYALKGLDIIFKEGYNYAKCGIMLMELTSDDNVQAGLFDTTDREKEKKLMLAMDKINNSFGKQLVRFAVQGYGRKWKLRAEKLSPRYTTRLSDILTIRI